MASKQVAKLINIKSRLQTWVLRANKFLKHKIMSQKKNLLIIGDNVEFKQSLTKQFNSIWDITYLQLGSEEQQGNKQFDSIIVMPPSNIKQLQCQFSDERILTDAFFSAYETAIKRNLWAYRMAHKHLSTTGILILTTSEKDFKQEEKVGAKAIIDGQICYLGVTIGDRDYTDLNSSCVIALGEELARARVDVVTEFYRKWAEGEKSPMPGSFAMFKKNKEKAKIYVEYL